jgi:integrase
MKAGRAWEEHNWVFCNIYGRFLEPTIVLRLFRALLKEVGLPQIRFHDLRHSAATFLLSMGVHPKVVQEILGHSQISMTMDTFSHVLPGMQQDAMEKMDDWFRYDSIRLAPLGLCHPLLQSNER